MNSHIIETLKQQITQAKIETEVEKVGQVVKIADGVATLSGLTDVMSGELIEFPNQVFGVALNRMISVISIYENQVKLTQFVPIHGG